MTSYRAAGVDLEGADRHVASIGPIVTATWGEDVVGGFGGFAAGVELPAGYERPVLMLTTDGVGTKLEIASATGLWDGVGHDLVAMCVDDLAAAGAEPVAFVDYMAVGALQAERDSRIVASIADACRRVGAALVGGETAEHPGVMGDMQVDLAGTALGVVEHGGVVDGTTVQPGDRIIGLASPNLRSNGFSLVRRVFSGRDLDDPMPDEDATLGEALMRPSRLYVRHVLEAVATGAVRGAAHITGGGLPGNVPRSLPDTCGAVLDPDTWEIPGVFRTIAAEGDIPWTDMSEVFNLGIGFCLVVDPERTDEVVAVTAEVDGRVIGEVTDGPGVTFASPID